MRNVIITCYDKVRPTLSKTYIADVLGIVMSFSLFVVNRILVGVVCCEVPPYTVDIYVVMRLTPKRGMFSVWRQ